MDEEIIEVAAEVMADAVAAVASDYSAGDIGDEDDYTSQLAGQLKASVNTLNDEFSEIDWSADAVKSEHKVQNPRMRISARRLTSRGPGAEEPQFGADLALVLDVNLPGIQFTKGVLIQSKIVNKHGDPINSQERTRLLDQCSKMLSVTPAAFVFTYGDGGVSVYSAALVEAVGAQDLAGQSTWGMKVFFTDLLKCWIGDPYLAATSREALAELRALVDARTALLLRASRKD